MDTRTASLIKKLRIFKKENHIDRLYLFGSRTHGAAHQWSDVDLLVVSKNFRGKGLLHRAPPLYTRWNVQYPVDFLCYTPEEYDALRKRVTIVKEAVENGIEIK